MSDVKKFNQAQEEVKELTKRPSNDELLPFMDCSSKHLRATSQHHGQG